MAGPQKRPKHVPERTCIVCHQKKPKWEMIRIVRTPQGALEIDNRGKKAGRGAYLCRIMDCWGSDLTKKRLEHALKTEINSEQRIQLIEYSKAFSIKGKNTERQPELHHEGARE